MPPQQNTYQGAGTGRKESPYASSPYQNQTYREYEYQPQYQPLRSPRSLPAPVPADGSWLWS